MLSVQRLRELFSSLRFRLVLWITLVVFVMVVVLVLFFKLALTRAGTGWRRVRSIRFRLWL